MKNNSIKIYSLITSISLLVFLFAPTNSIAQRFNHGGGGGMRGGGGGGMHGIGGFSRQPIQMNRSIGGGAHNTGHPDQVIRREDMHDGPHRGMDRPGGVFHPVFGNHPYAYHSYHPYIWGPRWHPFGFFLNSLAVDAFYFTLAGQPYYYDYGVFYVPYQNGYTAVAPPLGAVVGYLPEGYETVMVGDAVYYYYGGAFYINQGSSFRVVSAPEGAIIYQLPEGAVEQIINGQSYLLFNNTYYLPFGQAEQDLSEILTKN